MASQTHTSQPQEDQLAAAPDELLALDKGTAAPMRPPRSEPAPAATAAASNLELEPSADPARAPADDADEEDEEARMAAFQAALDEMDDEAEGSRSCQWWWAGGRRAGRSAQPSR